MVSDFATKYGILILEYLWIPIIVPILALLAKFVFSDKLLFIKEIKKVQDSDVEQFTQLYNARIDDSLRICVEEILGFVGEKPNNSIEHHLYICKKINKTVGFMKFMVSRELKYIFIAYVAIDKTDTTANTYGIKLLAKKLAKKFFNPKVATCIITEIEQGDNGAYRTPLSLLISRYAKMLGKTSYYIDLPYIQPQMPDDNNKAINDEFLSLLYIPYYSKENNYIAKSELLKIIQSIYFDIYGPSCNPALGCDCNAYYRHLEELLKLYQDGKDIIKIIPLER